MLFIGGSADGRNISVPDNRDIWEVPAFGKVPLLPVCGCVAKPETIKVDVYTRRKFDGFDLMALSTMTYPEIVRSLLNNYRPEVKF